jgi:hypothetical protein
MADGIEVTPEDREQLVDIRFGQLLEKHGVVKKDDIKNLLNEVLDERQASRPRRPTPIRQRDGGESGDIPAPAGRQSLFDISLRQALGI